MSEYLLDPAELLFLATTFGATSVIGVDRMLFPDKEDTSYMVQWESGYKSFLYRGWLAQQADGKFEMARAIAQIGSILVDPKLVLLVRLFLATGGIGTLTYYLGEDRIVEQILLDTGQYRLLDVANVNSMISRVTEAVSSSSVVYESPEQYIVGASALEMAVEAIRMNRIQEANRILASQLLSEMEISSLTAILMSAKKTAELEIGTPDNDTKAIPHGFAVIHSSSGTWMLVYSPPFEQVTIEQASATAIYNKLNTWVRQLLL